MKLDDTVMVQFFGELIESYRQQIMERTGAVKPTSVQDGDRTFWMHVRYQPD